MRGVVSSLVVDSEGGGDITFVSLEIISSMIFD